MDRSRILRRLRIAFSVVCGIVCLLLIVLWVHSYSYRDFIRAQHPAWGSASARSLQGKLSCLVDIYRRRTPRWKARWGVRSTPIEEAIMELEGIEPTLPEGKSATSFTIVKRPDLLGIVIPYWSLMLCAFFLAVAPWLPWSRRFSLRTLLNVLPLGIIGLSRPRSDTACLYPFRRRARS